MAWNNSNGVCAKSPKDNGRSGLPMTAVAVIFVVLVVAIVALFRSSSSDGEATRRNKPENPHGMIRDVGGQVKKTASANVPQSALTDTKASEAVEKPYYDTNKWQEVNGYLVPRGARLVSNYLTNKVHHVFRHSTDDVILAYLMPQQNGALPPMQPIMGGSDRIFLNSLKDPIVIGNDDSKSVREQKELVIVAREQIKERMDAGEKFADILQDHYKLMEDNAKIRRKAQSEFDRICREGDTDAARKYRLAIDAALQQMGIDGLDEPHPKVLKKARMQ